jgi:ABC-type amino acid transport system permease subunit
MKVFAGICSFFCFVAAITVPLVGQYLVHEGPEWMIQKSHYSGSPETGNGTFAFLLALFAGLVISGVVLAVGAIGEEPKK